MWTNHPNPKFKPLCEPGSPCHEPAPRGSRTGTQGLKNAKERSIIPSPLCEHIVDICEEYYNKILPCKNIKDFLIPEYKPKKLF